MQIRLKVTMRCTKCPSTSRVAEGTVDPSNPLTLLSVEEQIADEIPAPCACGLEYLRIDLWIDNEVVRSVPGDQIEVLLGGIGQKPFAQWLKDLKRN